jgi:putative membrane protein
LFDLHVIYYGIINKQHTKENNMMGGYGYGMSGGYGYGGIFMIFWLVLIIVGIVALVRWFSHPHPTGEHGGSKPLDILKERYARGEIDEQEFKKRKQDLL